VLRLASDANVHDGIIRGLRKVPGIDLTRVQEALPEGTSDPDILNWAAAESRVLITCDKKTMIGFASQRFAEGNKVSGLIVMSQKMPIGSAIEGICRIAESMTEQEMQDQLIGFLPYRG
jgi:Domain of unknown function (DUF5615)